MEREPTFMIGNIPVYGDVILAPMAGYADVPHRAICRSFGSAMNYTEFISAEDILTRNKYKWSLLDFKPAEERPMVFQIFSNRAEKLLDAALKIAPLEPDIIDINMGCSTRRVSGRGAGVGMMKNPTEVAKTFELLVSNLPMPITGKIRLGWDEAENYLEIGKILQESGASAVAIHPRTKEQKYSGIARWDAIAELVQALSIPVIGNGDISEPKDIDAMLDYTKCAGVMIGRGAIGNPWIFGRKAKSDLSFDQLIDAIIYHAQEMVAYHGAIGLVKFRKHLKRYLGGETIDSQSMHTLLTTETWSGFVDQLRALQPITAIIA